MTHWSRLESPSGKSEPVRQDGGSRFLALELFRTRFLWIALTAFLLPAAVLAIQINQSPRAILCALIFAAAMCLYAWPWRREEPAAPPIPDPSDRAAMLEAEVRAARASLRRADAWMRLFPLGVLLAALMKFTSLTDLRMSEFFPLILKLTRTYADALTAIVILLCVMAYFGGRSFQLTRKLKRLEQMLASERQIAVATRAE